MKKILSIIFILLSLCCNAQYRKCVINDSKGFPTYVLDAKTGEQIGVVVSIKQAQKLDKKLDQNKTTNNDCDSTINYLVRVNNDFKDLAVLDSEKINVSDSAMNTFKSEITNLKSQIDIEKGEVSIRDHVIVNKNEIIDIDKLQIKHIKKQRDIIAVGGSILSGSLIYLLIKK
jgi:hypothetical protein